MDVKQEKEPPGNEVSGEFVIGGGEGSEIRARADHGVWLIGNAIAMHCTHRLISWEWMLLVMCYMGGAS